MLGQVKECCGLSFDFNSGGQLANEGYSKGVCLSSGVSGMLAAVSLLCSASCEGRRQAVFVSRGPWGNETCKVALGAVACTRAAPAGEVR